MEEISGQLQCRCSGVILLEKPQRFGIMGDQICAWPQIHKITEGTQTVVMQAVPEHFQEFLHNSREVLAVRGFPDDKAGLALQAIIALYLEYLSQTSLTETLTIFRPSYFLPQAKDHKKVRPGIIIGEIYGITYLLREDSRERFNSDLRIASLGCTLSFQQVLGWNFQLANQLALLRAAHPGVVAQEYHTCTILGLRPGQRIQTLYPMLRAQGENKTSMVIAAYVEPRARTFQVGATTLEEDHLVLIYPSSGERPHIGGTADIRALCHGDQGALFSVARVGDIVPGWMRMLTYYGWLSKQPSVISNRAQNEEERPTTSRDGFTKATTGKAKTGGKRDQRLYREVVTRSAAATVAVASARPTNTGTTVIRGLDQPQVTSMVNAALATQGARFLEVERSAATALATVGTLQTALWLAEDARVRANIRVEELEGNLQRLATATEEAKTVSNNRIEVLEHQTEVTLSNQMSIYQKLKALQQELQEDPQTQPLRKVRHVAAHSPMMQEDAQDAGEPSSGPG